MNAKWLLLIAAVAVFAVALAMGVSWGMLLLFGTVLLCPAAMYFGMRGMGGHGNSVRGEQFQDTSPGEKGQHKEETGKKN